MNLSHRLEMLSDNHYDHMDLYTKANRFIVIGCLLYYIKEWS